MQLRKDLKSPFGLFYKPSKTTTDATLGSNRLVSSGPVMDIHVRKQINAVFHTSISRKNV